MSRREEAKELNRGRIRVAAEEIIRDEGMDKLTMRRLADRAGVSLRTPYNLFGSKTAVLIALLDDAQKVLVQNIGIGEDRLVIEQLFDALQGVERFFSQDESFYRDVYWAIMASDQPEVRRVGFDQVILLCQQMLHRAQENEELRTDCDTTELGRHLAIQMMAILGMWGSGFFSNTECIKQIRRAWCGDLLNQCSNKTRPFLTSAYEETV